MPISFASPGPQLNYFGTDAGGWSSQNRYPRLLADINNDGKADIVGFADTGVFTSLALKRGVWRPAVPASHRALGDHFGWLERARRLTPGCGHQQRRLRRSRRLRPYRRPRILGRMGRLHHRRL
jgi:hypothetical protein